MHGTLGFRRQAELYFGIRPPLVKMFNCQVHPTPAFSRIVYGMFRIELAPANFVENSNMTTPRHSVLVASRDPKLADVRKTVLEEAGFEVIQVTDLKALRDACEKQEISLIMI